MEDKKKRGPNLTTEEKTTLLELIKKYQNIIENKKTNAAMISKKREAWELISHQYNSLAVSGPRTFQQLRHLHENLKQRSKKNIATVNRLQFYDEHKEIKKKAMLDKKERNRTGVGPYSSIITEQDAQILARVATQIQPLHNPYDDAGDEDIESNSLSTITQMDINKSNDTTSTDDNEIIAEGNKVVKTTLNITPTSNLAESVRSNKDSTKEKYFKLKLRNAKLETILGF